MNPGYGRGRGGGGGRGGMGGGYSSGIWSGTNSNLQPVPMATAASGGGGPGKIPQEFIRKIKKPSFKLRKAIHPKPALLLLNELLTGKKPRYEFYDIPQMEKERRAWNRGLGLEEVPNFDCVCIIDENEYLGDGQNKNDARNSAAESAIQGEIVKRCNMNSTSRSRQSEDFCPWGLIASLALSRMYESWKLQGYAVPKELECIPSDSSSSRNSMSSGGADNWMEKETKEKPPLAQVNEMLSRSGLGSEFTLVEETGLPNEKVFVFQLTIAGQHRYSGKAKSKKLAKQNAAENALADSASWYAPRPKASDINPNEEELGGGAMDVDQD